MDRDREPAAPDALRREARPEKCTHVSGDTPNACTASCEACR
jgi:hypothetical protein